MNGSNVFDKRGGADLEMKPGILNYSSGWSHASAITKTQTVNRIQLFNLTAASKRLAVNV